MAVTTRTVCDACGAATRNNEETKVLTVELIDHFRITLDVHPNARCIPRAVRAAVEKHFAVIADKEDIQTKQDTAASASAAASQKPEARQPVTRQPIATRG